MTHIIDIADQHVTDDPGETLVTHSLGSCIGLVIWDPVVHVGGMLHYMLPESSLAPEKAKANPSMFADTGVPLLFKSAYALGAQKQRLVVKVAGGASLLDEKGTFNIGKRNHVMLQKLFWKNGVLVQAEEVGGAISRTVRLDVGSGRVTISSQNKVREL